MQRGAYRTYPLTAALVLFATCITAAAQDAAERERLRAQPSEFRKEVIRVTDGVYGAVGYSASNVILIQGATGSIIFDTSTDPVAARAIKVALADLNAGVQLEFGRVTAPTPDGYLPPAMYLLKDLHLSNGQCARRRVLKLAAEIAEHADPISSAISARSAANSKC